MGGDEAWTAAGQFDVGSAETGLAVLVESCERVVEELGSTVPPAQLRALLITGRTVAEWVRASRRDVLGDVLQAMSPGGREALVQGLRELAGDAGRADLPGKSAA